MSKGKCEGGMVRSTHITFVPQDLTCGTYTADTKTAGRQLHVIILNRCRYKEFWKVRSTGQAPQPVPNFGDVTYTADAKTAGRCGPKGLQMGGCVMNS
eukprot:1159389-Pelagomonas_calceolata.AAC.6